MSEGLKQYNALLAQIKAARGYKPGMGAAGAELLKQCRAEASAKHAASKGKPAPAPRAPAAAKPRVMAPRAKLSGAMHSCAGLPQDPCEVAPNCFWQPKAKRCMTKSGKGAVATFDNPTRNALLAQIRTSRRQQQQGGYWY
jgi:hypothetical protein